MSDNLNVYVTEEYGDDNKKLYTKVGTAFPHKQGGGFNIVLRKGISVSDRLVVFPKKPEDAAGDE